jgi:periplasmic protein TonB
MKNYIHLFCLCLPWLLTSCASTQEEETLPHASLTDVGAPVYNLQDVDSKPMPKGHRVGLLYPFELKRAGIEGEAVIEFVVDVSGSVRDIRIVSASRPAFGQAAAEAVAKWRYKPGIKDGRPVNTRMRIPMSFNLSRG